MIIYIKILHTTVPLLFLKNTIEGIEIPLRLNLYSFIPKYCFAITVVSYNKTRFSLTILQDLYVLMPDYYF